MVPENTGRLSSCLGLTWIQQSLLYPRWVRWGKWSIIPLQPQPSFPSNASGRVATRRPTPILIHFDVFLAAAAAAGAANAIKVLVYCVTSFSSGAMLIFWPRLPSPSKAAKESITKDSDGPVPVITIPWLRPSCAWLSQSRATGLSPRRLSQLPKINPTRPVAPTRRRRGRLRAACFRPSRGFARVNPRPRSRRARPAAIRVKPLSLQAEAPGTARNTGSRAGIYGTVSRSESISSESVSSESVLWPDAATSRGRDP